MFQNSKSSYENQVRLLLEVLPHVTSNPNLALKGGTAINLFVRDLPRLSVDIDLMYLPVTSREHAFKEINETLAEAAQTIKKTISGVVVKSNKPFNSGEEIKIIVEMRDSKVKVEPNYTLRGSVFPSSIRTLSKQCQAQFGAFAAIQVVSIEDLYAGKICAALDRQHPRDMFDIHWMLEDKGVTVDIKLAFMVYLMSHNRPLSELLSPNWKNLEAEFKIEFEGMTKDDVSLEKLQETGPKLLTEIFAQLTEVDKIFLLNFKLGTEDWNHFFKPEVQFFPAIRWKQHNLAKLSYQKRAQAVKKLESVLF